MIKEKVLFGRGRVSVCFVSPEKEEKRYFSCFYVTPTLLTFTMNTYTRGERYMYTRFIGIHFWFWSIELGIKYGAA